MNRESPLLAGVRARWQALAPRERLMLATMALSVVAFVLWVGVVRPLQAIAHDAGERHRRAADDLREVEAAARVIRALEAGRPAPPAGEAFGRTVLDAASAGNVAITRQRTGEGGAFAIGIDAVAAPALFSWLEALRTGHGITPESLQVRERNGALQVDASFKPPGGPRT